MSPLPTRKPNASTGPRSMQACRALRTASLCCCARRYGVTFTRAAPLASTGQFETLAVVRRLLVDLNWGGRMTDGRGVTHLALGERRNGELPADLAPGHEILLADYDLPDGSPAWIEIPAQVIAEDDGWSAV